MSKKKYFPVDGNRRTQKRVVPRSQPPVPTIKRNEKVEMSPTNDAQRLKRAYTFEYRIAQSALNGEPSEYLPSPTFERQGVWRRIAEQLRKQDIDPVGYVRVLIRELRSERLFADTGLAKSRSTAKRAAQDIEAELKRSKSPKQDSKHVRKVFVNLENWNNCHPPTPAQITNPTYLKLYEKTIERDVENARLELTLQTEAACRNIKYAQGTMRASPDFSYANTILGNHVELSPLFRYGLAISEVKVPETSPEQVERNALFRRMAKRFFEPACLQYLSNKSGYDQEWGQFVSPTIVREAERVYDQFLSEIQF
jgi:hypothetical protein